MTALQDRSSLYARQGGNRKLRFLWIIDASESTGRAGKIEAINLGGAAAVKDMRAIAAAYPQLQVEVGCIRYSRRASWTGLRWSSLDTFEWPRIAAEAPPASRTEIVFLLDTSGSMSDEIETVKLRCEEFASRISDVTDDVKIGLVGFDIGGHARPRPTGYRVANLATYTLGIWPLTSPSQFRRNIRSLELGLFGGSGCYLANRDTIEIFPQVAKVFTPRAEVTASRQLVIISDELGGTQGLDSIVAAIRQNQVTAHVLGTRPADDRPSPHEEIARQTDGKFWDIRAAAQTESFAGIFDRAAVAIREAVSQVYARGVSSTGTNMAKAIDLATEELQKDPSPERSLPPVITLIADQEPVDDVAMALKRLNAEASGRAATRFAIATSEDLDSRALRGFARQDTRKLLAARDASHLAHLVKLAATSGLREALRVT